MTLGTFDHEEILRIAKKIQRELCKRKVNLAVIAVRIGSFAIMDPGSEKLLEILRSTPGKLVGVYSPGVGVKLLMADLKYSIRGE